MRSTRRARSQRGSSLVEAVVASALMGIGVVGGLTAWDTAETSAARAARIAWANSIVRSKMDGILSAEYPDSYPVPAQSAVGAALAANLQTDSHRYLHCDGTPVSTPLPTDMALCMPDDRANADAMVTYHVTGSGPWVITRQVGARTAFMLRSNTRPFFWID